MALPLECTTSQANGGDNEFIGEVAVEGDGVSGMALTLACTTSQANGGDNEVVGKVGGGRVCVGLTTTTTYTPSTESSYRILGPLGSILNGNLSSADVVSALSTLIQLHIIMALKKETRS
jgi:hypothetical protein